MASGAWAAGLSSSPSPGTGYILLDMTPSGVGSAGCLVISQRSNKDDVWKEVPVRLTGGRGITMEKLVGAVRENGMEKFSFTESGVGCRF